MDWLDSILDFTTVANGWEVVAALVSQFLAVLAAVWIALAVQRREFRKINDDRSEQRQLELDDAKRARDIDLNDVALTRSLRQDEDQREWRRNAVAAATSAMRQFGEDLLNYRRRGELEIRGENVVTNTAAENAATLFRLDPRPGGARVAAYYKAETLALVGILDGASMDVIRSRWPDALAHIERVESVLLRWQRGEIANDAFMNMLDATQE